jgi:transposase
MLKVDRVHAIRHQVLVQGRSRRVVAQEMGVSRNTVRKYLDRPEPVRIEKQPRPRPVLEVVQPRLEQLLEEWSTRTTAKQRITGTRLVRQLRQEGYAVGTSLVRDYLRERRRQGAETYVPLVHRAGEDALVDFFEVVADIAGERRKGWMFVMRVMHSGRDFAVICERQDQVSFLDGHVRAFQHFGFVPWRIVYDNFSAAVRKIVMPAAS